MNVQSVDAALRARDGLGRLPRSNGECNSFFHNDFRGTVCEDFSRRNGPLGHIAIARKSERRNNSSALHQSYGNRGGLPSEPPGLPQPGFHIPRLSIRRPGHGWSPPPRCDFPLKGRRRRGVSACAVPATDKTNEVRSGTIPVPLITKERCRGRRTGDPCRCDTRPW